MAALTEQRTVQRIAPFVRFISQLHATVLHNTRNDLCTQHIYRVDHFTFFAHYVYTAYILKISITYLQYLKH